jgi:hypothetical protein
MGCERLTRGSFRRTDLTRGTARMGTSRPGSPQLLDKELTLILSLGLLPSSRGGVARS